MMNKLIDADVVKAYLKRAIFGADPRIDKWVDAMPEADAIPMDWLLDLIHDGDPELSKAAAKVKRAWEWEQQHHAPGK